MATQIAHNSKETIIGLIDKAFNEIDFARDFCNRSDELIQLAKDLSLMELAEDLDNRRDIEIQNL